MSFYNETPVKRTRRARRCDWCHEQIEQGAPSVATSGVFEGDFYTGRYHPECNAAAHRYYIVHQCWGEEMPYERMNRGGIKAHGEPEAIPEPDELPTIICTQP
jgi:hypothetical protein